MKKFIYWTLTILLISGLIAALSYFHRIDYFFDSLLLYLKTLTWPIILGCSIWYFRLNIADLITRIRHFGVAGASVDTERAKDSQQSDQLENKLLLQAVNDAITHYQSQLEEVRNDASISKQELSQQLAFTHIQLDFEQIYNRIFGSQVVLLQLLKNTSYGDRHAIDNYFQNEFRKPNTPLFNDWTIDTYAHFLIERHLLVQLPNGGYSVSEYGKAFLNYITASNYAPKAL